MADQTTNALLGICKTLSDVVAPAVTADDPLAQQELRMAIRYLAFLRERVDQTYARARFETAFHTDLARTVDGLLEAATSPSGEALAEIAERGTALLEAADTTIEELRACTGSLTEAVGHAVREAQGGPRQADVERAVLDASGTMTAFERSWYLPLGMDHFAAEVEPLESFLPRTGAGDDVP